MEMRKRWIRFLLILPILAGVFAIPGVRFTGGARAAEPFKLEILDPRAEIFTPPQVPVSPRLSTLAGKKIGILNNTKPGADSFLPFMEKALKEVFPTVEFKTFQVSYNAYPGKEKDLKALADWSDGVIGLLGD
jgi:hypothetical protein